MRTLCLIVVLTCSASAQWEPNTVDNRQVLVHLFEWKWTDIADECERYLGPNGFGGVQISPPNEHCMIRSPRRPWWERYQPVSYKLTSRSGTQNQLRDMIGRCNDAGVRIYADAVINHMARGDSGVGTAGTWYDVGALSYPGVPFNKTHFSVPNGKCTSGSGNVENYIDVNQVRNCRLEGLPDLDTSTAHVRSKIADYMNELIDLGVAGFRVDAAKFIWPSDLGEIFGSLKNLSTAYFPRGSRPFIFQEVTDGGEREGITADDYVPLGRVTEFKFGLKLAEAMRSSNGLSSFGNFSEVWGMIPDLYALVFVDNHDNQRGHGVKGVITFKEPRAYTIANAFMLAFPYGVARVMSSFFFDDTEAGPPADAQGDTVAIAVDGDGTCRNGWVCEHRWSPIKNMVGFRNAAAGQPVANWWSNGKQQIAFGRGDKAFVVINNDDYVLSETLYTGMPPGDYCDVIMGKFDPSSGSCSGPTIHVDKSGNAFFHVDTGEQPIAAIHVLAKVSRSNA